MSSAPALIDPFGRTIDYVRLSVTDRCDFRCVYCMSEEMRFLPKADILSLEELYELSATFVEMGVKRLRLTGGEPLVRHNVLELFQRLGRLSGLEELLVTTNGSRLTEFAKPLRQAGVNRLNISLDTLNSQRFTELTRTGKLEQVLAGIDAARRAGFDRIKLNSVILQGRNHDEVVDLVQFAVDRDLDISFIEEMPLGEIVEHSRQESFYSSDQIRRDLNNHFDLITSHQATAGPSNYYQIAGHNSRVGFISPHSHNFCHLCNRVRLTVEGRLLLCLGNEHSMDLKPILRSSNYRREQLRQAIQEALHLKPEQHHFTHDDGVQVVRFMNMTGG